METWYFLRRGTRYDRPPGTYNLTIDTFDYDEHINKCTLNIDKSLAITGVLDGEDKVTFHAYVNDVQVVVGLSSEGELVLSSSKDLAIVFSMESAKVIKHDMLTIYRWEYLDMPEIIKPFVKNNTILFIEFVCEFVDLDGSNRERLEEETFEVTKGIVTHSKPAKRSKIPKMSGHKGRSFGKRSTGSSTKTPGNIGRDFHTVAYSDYSMESCSTPAQPFVSTLVTDGTITCPCIGNNRCCMQWESQFSLESNWWRRWNRNLCLLFNWRITDSEYRHICL